MNDILKYCIKVNGITAYYPMYDEVSTKTLESTPEMAMKYGWNNGKVSFVTKDGDYYVTPFCVEVVEALGKLGYVDGNLYVPFSNGDVPSDKTLAARWDSLCSEARKSSLARQEREKRERYRQLASEKHLSPLSEEIYKLCLEIPENGLEVTAIWNGDEKFVDSPIEEWRVPECMGTYCYNNGKVAFVDAEGKTFVTPFNVEVAEALRKAGYVEKGLFVALSNGEEIIDPQLASRWDSLCSEARKHFIERQEREKRERYHQLASEKHLSPLSEEIYKLCLEIPEKGLEVTAIWNGDEKFVDSPIDEWRVPECMGTYCYNNGKVAFVDPEGKTFVTPFNVEVEEALRKAGYVEKGLFVALSNGERIVDPQLSSRWDSLCSEARKRFDERYERGKRERYHQIASEKHLSPLSEEIYKLCLEIPEKGLEVTAIWNGDEQFVDRPIEEWRVPECMGTYCYNNGKVAFVDPEGKTFVTPFNVDVAEALRKAGYVEKGLFVALSNGEHIVDPQLASRWDSLCSEARKRSLERYEREKQERYRQLASEKHLSPLSEEIYRLCLEIPEKGLEVTAIWNGDEKFVTNPVSEDRVSKCMGTYCVNNGKVAFVDPEGKTFVSPFTLELTEALSRAKYVRSGLGVPLSNGEEIVDPQLAARWEALCSEDRKRSLERYEREKQERYRQLASEKHLTPLSEEIYKLSLEIPEEGLKTTRAGEESVTTPVEEWRVPECMGTYCTNNGKVSFVDSEGKTFVSPFTLEVVEALSKAGYERKGLFVPLSNGEEIVDPQLAARWNALYVEEKKQAAEKDKRDKRDRYRRLAAEKHLTTLSEETYGMCLEIPEEGLEVTAIWNGDEPFVTGPIQDWRVPECMGTYCCNNGKVAFVDAEGKTFVSPFVSEIEEALIKSGYQERGLFVPLSNGEQITNPTVANRWNSMCKQAYDRLVDEIGQKGNGEGGFTV